MDCQDAFQILFSSTTYVEFFSCLDFITLNSSLAYHNIIGMQLEIFFMDVYLLLNPIN